MSFLLGQTTPRLARTLGFNVSHDKDLIVMAFHSRTDPIAESPASLDERQQTKSEGHETGLGSQDVTTIGVDVMKVHLPSMEATTSGFINSLSDTVRHPKFSQLNLRCASGLLDRPASVTWGPC